MEKRSVRASLPTRICRGNNNNNNNNNRRVQRTLGTSPSADHHTLFKTRREFSQKTLELASNHRAESASWQRCTAPMSTRTAFQKSKNLSKRTALKTGLINRAQRPRSPPRRRDRARREPAVERPRVRSPLRVSLTRGPIFQGHFSQEPEMRTFETSKKQNSAKRPYRSGAPPSILHPKKAPQTTSLETTLNFYQRDPTTDASTANKPRGVARALARARRRARRPTRRARQSTRQTHTPRGGGARRRSLAAARDPRTAPGPKRLSISKPIERRKVQQDKIGDF